MKMGVLLFYVYVLSRLTRKPKWKKVKAKAHWV